MPTTPHHGCSRADDAPSRVREPASFTPSPHPPRGARPPWALLFDRRKNEAQKAGEEEGYTLRGALLDACRWNMRCDPALLRRVSAIAEGEGLADLIQDLHDVAERIEANAELFATDDTLDVGAQVQAARQLSAALSEARSDIPTALERNEARGLRDRAYTALAEIVNELREAGRYAFRLDKPMAARFVSAHLRRRRRAADADADVVDDAAQEMAAAAE